MAWTTPSTWVSGAILTAAQLNTQLRDNMNAIGDPWTAYTPTWTNLTVGNATQNSAYIAAGKLHIIRINLLWGSTTSISGIPEFTLPNSVSVNANYHATFVFGVGSLMDASAGLDYQSPIMRSSSTAARMRFLTVATSGTYAAADQVSATIPFTWTTSDRLSCTVVFEAA